MGFHYIAQLSVFIKKHHSVHKQKRNEFLFAKEMHGSVLNEFWQVFCLICTVYLEGWAVYCENGPFPCFPMTVWILLSDNLLSFLVHSNESDCFFHSAAAVATLLEGRLMKKTIRFVFRSPENSKGCLIRESKQSLLSKEMVHFHSALLNLPGSQCKAAENPSKLIAHRAVHFSRSCQLVPFSFFNGNILFLFVPLVGLITKKTWGLNLTVCCNASTGPVLFTLGGNDHFQV